MKGKMPKSHAKMMPKQHQKEMKKMMEEKKDHAPKKRK